MSDFWRFFWLVLELFILLSFLIVLFQIFGDLFSDSELGGLAKAVWVVVLIALPLIGALAYLIARGRGMGRRRVAKAAQAQADVESYIRSAAGRHPASELASAKSLLDSGAITQAEFDKVKSLVLA